MKVKKGAKRMLNHPNAEKAPIEGKIITKKRFDFIEISYIFEKKPYRGLSLAPFPIWHIFVLKTVGGSVMDVSKLNQML